MDRLLARGYTELRRSAGAGAALDLAQAALEAAADGITITATHSVDELEAGLLKITVVLEWSRAAHAGRETGTLSVTRYLADPAAAAEGAGGGATA